MNRFKFRAWHTANKIMIKHKLLSVSLKNIGNDNAFVFMQWSGLTDKSGTDIYEGDVVYIAGYGYHYVEFPFIELYEADIEKDIGKIIGNIYETRSY